MDDYNGTHENGNMELLMDGDYRNYCGDHDGGDLNDGNYNNADNNNDGDNNDDDEGESSDSDDDSDSDSDDDDSMTILMRSLTSLWQLPVKQL